jgi:hypothetical protein
VRLMFWGSRAPWSRSEDRCDGAGSEADGAKPPVKPGPMLPVLGVLVLGGKSAWVKLPSSGLRIDRARSWPGRFCPAYRMPFAVRGGGAEGMTDNAVFSGLVRWKLFIHWLFPRGAAGFRGLCGAATLGRARHSATVR